MCQLPLQLTICVAAVTTGVPAACAEPPATAKQSWPLDYRLPTQFPENVTFALVQQTNLNKPKERYLRGLFVQTIVYNVLRQYTMYPDKAQKTDMARAIIREFPHLRDLSANGYCSWYQSIADCLKNARRTLKSVPEVARRSRKKKQQLSTHAVASVEPTATSVTGPVIMSMPNGSVPVGQSVGVAAVEPAVTDPVVLSMPGSSVRVGQSVVLAAVEPTATSVTGPVIMSMPNGSVPVGQWVAPSPQNCPFPWGSGPQSNTLLV